MRIHLILAAVLLSACSYLETPVLSPYKMDIRQGNYITAEMRDKLRLGMTRSQVRFVLGTPMLSDPFHAARWDYVYRLEHEGKIVEQHDLTVFFEGDNLTQVLEAGKPVTLESMPTPEPIAAPAETATPEASAPQGEKP
jgi:outer membrane protein assembly factor BamE